MTMGCGSCGKATACKTRLVWFAPWDYTMLFPIGRDRTRVQHGHKQLCGSAQLLLSACACVRGRGLVGAGACVRTCVRVGGRAGGRVLRRKVIGCFPELDYCAMFRGERILPSPDFGPVTLTYMLLALMMTLPTTSNTSEISFPSSSLGPKAPPRSIFANALSKVRRQALWRGIWGRCACCPMALESAAWPNASRDVLEAMLWYWLLLLGVTGFCSCMKASRESVKFLQDLGHCEATGVP